MKWREELRVTLWANVAESFSSLSAEAFNPPIMIVLTSLKVKLYLENIVLNSTGSSLFFIDPNIVELNAYKSVFANCTEAVKKLPPSSKHANEAEVLQAAKKVTIEELAFLDPDLHKRLPKLCQTNAKGSHKLGNWFVKNMEAKFRLLGTKST
nr:uncharacterized protein LOC103432014 isoform X2 [Malus domestica]